MTSLENILKATLNSFSDAEFEVDKHAATIAKYYQKDEILSHMTIPNIKVQHAEIEIRYAPLSNSLKKDVLVCHFDRLIYRYSIRSRRQGKEMARFRREASFFFRTNFRRIISMHNEIDHEFLREGILQIISTNNLSDQQTQRVVSSMLMYWQFICDRLVTEPANVESGIVVDPDELSHFPETIISTLRFKIGNEGHKWEVMEDKDGKRRDPLLIPVSS